MTPEKAKLLLSGTRPGDEEIARRSDNSELCEAFDLLESDGALRAWYEEECAFDDAIGRKMKAIAIPDGLRESLAEAAVPARTTSFPMMTWLAAAAAVLLIGVFFLMQQNGRGTELASLDQKGGTYGCLCEGVTEFANGKFELAHFANDLSDLNEWVTQQSAPGLRELPDKIAQLDGMGCTIVNWGPHKVSMFCMKKGDTEGSVVHLFVIDRSAVAKLPDIEKLNRPGKTNGLETVAWEDDRHLYLLVGAEPGVGVSDFL